MSQLSFGLKTVQQNDSNDLTDSQWFHLRVIKTTASVEAESEFKYPLETGHIRILYPPLASVIIIIMHSVVCDLAISQDESLCKIN